METFVCVRAGGRVPQRVQVDALEAGSLGQDLEPLQQRRGSTGVPISVVRTEPLSRHVLAAVRRPSSCRTRCAWIVSTAERGRGTVLRDLPPAAGTDSALVTPDSQRVPSERDCGKSHLRLLFRGQASGSLIRSESRMTQQD